LACPGFGIDFVSSSLSIVVIGVSLAFAVSALFVSCDEALLGDAFCVDVSGVGDELDAEESAEGVDGGADDGGEDSGADGEVGVRAAMRCLATSSRLQAPSARLSANSDNSAAWIRIFI
jgi:hypothetical protein